MARRPELSAIQAELTRAGVPGVAGGSVPTHVPPELVRLIDYEAPNHRDDPFSVTEGIFEDLPPVFYWPHPRPGRFDGTWVVTRYEDIREVYQNDALYSTKGATNFVSLVGEDFPMIPLAIDPPDHGKYRLLLNPWFSPKAVNAIETGIRDQINSLIDGFVHNGECDVAYDFGRIYPVRVFLDLMGFPQESLDDFLSWEYALLHSNYDVERIRWGVSNALAFLRDFVERVRSTPNDRLASYVVHGSVEGRPLTEDEIIGTIFFLWVGGLDTVAASSALMFRRMALQPEVQQLLRNRPDLHTEAVEEFLRVQPIVNSARLVKEDHVIKGITVRKGDHVMCYNMAGNFDPEEFADPRILRFDRPSNRHFTLAGGPHRCLGSHLARRELRIALTEFLRRVPPFRLHPQSDRSVTPGLMAASRVPIVWR